VEKLFPDYIFVFCGTGSYEKEIQTSFKKMSNMIMPGYVNSINLAYLRSVSYLALQPIENRFDYTKSLSNKFFEYISSGLPIITSLRGITESEIKKNKIGYTYKNEIDLFDVMAKLYNDHTLRNNMSKNAKKLFIDKFSHEKVYNNFAIHCENVVKNFNNLK
jgi:glycosyltransferase involved in cell wall biosynthesis